MSDQYPFCSPAPDAIILESLKCRALWDAYPSSKGHALIVPARHVASFFDLTAEEQSEMLELLPGVRSEIERDLSPDGYNLGLNDGRAAGQTIDHVHLHLIPRYEGDASDPRGGVRWVLPETAAYWENPDR